MEKLFNVYSLVTAVVGGIAVKVFGGFDVLMQTMLMLTVLDYITGLTKAFVQKEVSSYRSFKGIAKKVLMYAVIACGVCVGNVIGDAVPLREIVLMFFIANEGISLLENAAEFVPIPEKLKDVLVQLREKGEK